MKTTMLVAAAAAGLLACGHGTPPAQAARPRPSPRTARTAVVERRGGETRLAAGTVAARDQATLAARVMAAVRSLPREEGEGFAAGEALVTLDDRSLRAALAAAEAAQAEAAADLRRLEALVARGAATPREKDAAVAREAATRAAVDGAREQLAYAVLRAPFAGRVARRPVSVGDVVAPGQPLLEIEGGAGHELRASVDAATAALLQVGQALEAEVDDVPGLLSARVAAVSRAGDAATHRFLVKAALDPHPGLRSGLFARLRVPGPGDSPRLVMPAAAAVERGGLTGAWVAEGGEARLRWIALGRVEGTTVEVRAGLREGERVVLEAQGLADGTPLLEAR